MDREDYKEKIMKYGWTKFGVCKILDEDGARVKIMLPGRKKGRWISRTQLLSPQLAPRKIRLIKRVNFDQTCGCTSVVDFRGTKMEAYNVYGKMSAFNGSKTTKGLATTPHLRRKHLREDGFVRARGLRRTIKDMPARLYRYLHRGYQVVS